MRTLLHAEDDPGLISLVRDTFPDFTVESVTNGLDALTALRDNPQRYSILILDLVLPWVNGLDVLAAVRQSPETVTLPVLVTTGTFVTANEFADDRYVSVLRKPFDINQLRIAVEQRLLVWPGRTDPTQRGVRK